MNKNGKIMLLAISLMTAQSAHSMEWVKTQATNFMALFKGKPNYSSHENMDFPSYDIKFENYNALLNQYWNYKSEAIPASSNNTMKKYITFHALNFFIRSTRTGCFSSSIRGYQKVMNDLAIRIKEEYPQLSHEKAYYKALFEATNEVMFEKQKPQHQRLKEYKQKEPLLLKQCKKLDDYRYWKAIYPASILFNDAHDILELGKPDLQKTAEHLYKNGQPKNYWKYRTEQDGQSAAKKTAEIWDGVAIDRANRVSKTAASATAPTKQALYDSRNHSDPILTDTEWDD